MSGAIVQSKTGVTLVGGGAFAPGLLAHALQFAPRLVAADGGADRALSAGHEPEAVIGDMDSLSASGRERLGEGRLHRIAEQETTDFDKALRSIHAPFVLAVGFTGARMDHTLGMFDVLLRHRDRRCLTLGESDLCFLCPTELTLSLDPGTRLSLFPMGEVRGTSTGLRWPIGGIDFAPGGRTGLSNEARGPEVRLSFSAPRMLLIVPLTALEPAIAALRGAPG